jgi:hypothetical protein
MNQQTQNGKEKKKEDKMAKRWQKEAEAGGRSQTAAQWAGPGRCQN